jgi:hypothetical protein
METLDTFSYDKELFFTLNKFGKLKFIKHFINDTVSRVHDSSLESNIPYNNAYYLYSDGSITRCKKEYMDSAHANFISYEIVSPNNFFTFPCISQHNNDTYCILTSENSYKIKNLIDELLLQV